MDGPETLQPYPVSGKRARQALIALIAGAVCIGLSPILVRLSEVGPVATAFYRVWLGLPLMWLWVRYERRRHRDVDIQPLPLRRLMLLLLPGVFFAADLGFWHSSIELTSIANATLLCNLAPIHVTLVSALFFGERFSRTFIVALLLAISGVAVLMGAGTGTVSGSLTGDLLALTASLFYAAYLLTVARMRSYYSAVTIMYWSSLMAGAVLLLPCLLEAELPLPETVFGWVVLFTLALVSHLGGQGLIAWALAHLSTAFTSLGLLLQPVVASVLAWWLFGEMLGPAQWLGGLVVMASIYLARIASSR